MTNNIISFIMPTYGERKIEFVEGDACYLISSDNKKYLDFGSGIAVNSLGHCHPDLVKKLQEQAGKLWHTSNLYYSSKQEEYAKILCNNSFAEKVFFTNSGVESIEAGLKVVKTFHNYHKNYNKKEVITFNNGFHGRTIAALSTQRSNKDSLLFGPLLEGFVNIPFNDIDSVKRSVNEKTSAILIEPIQGEGGIRPANLKYLEKLRQICDDNKILFFLDEVQSGFGRSGKLFAYQWANFQPDIIATAKGIASGFPLGACLTTNEACIGMTKGIHGSTFGGNPLAIAVGMEVIKILLQDNFLEEVDRKARYLWDNLIKLKTNFDEITEIRGAGLLLGIKTKTENTIINNLFLKNGLLCVPAKDNIIRIAPPLIVEKNQIDEALQIIEKTLKEI